LTTGPWPGKIFGEGETDSTQGLGSVFSDSIDYVELDKKIKET